ncbi:MAG TPA: GNAT family N-acetyltransferase [Solirubrobacterales bacterium]|nr:GNAT family N-acetyltransferase [Solirubrobacterales bacterium]
MSARFGAVEPLAPHHRVDHFECGREQLDRWLRAYAGQGQRRGTARTFIVCRQGETDVVGYYTLVASQIEQREATGEVQRGTSTHFPIPFCLIARLAVDRSEQGIGLGRSLLLDALQRTDRASRSIAMRALLVNALDGKAAAFYARFGFKPASAEPLTLMVPLEAVRHTLDKWEA